MGILSLRDPTTWRPAIAALSSDIVGQPVISELRRNPPRHFVSDDPAWIDDAARRAGTFQEPDTFSVLTSRFPSAFEKVLAYHACRPEQPVVVAREGLRGLNPRAIQGHAAHLFSMPLDAIERAASERPRSTSEGRVHLGLDDAFLVKHCADYLRFGSEYLLGIARALERTTGRDYAHELCSRGTPTIFVCEIPIAQVDLQELYEVAAELFTAWVATIATGREHHPLDDMTLTIQGCVPPAWIVGHYHPLSALGHAAEGASQALESSVSCALCRT